MKHKSTLGNDCLSEYFEANSVYKAVIIRNIKYSNSEDVSTLNCNWVQRPFGEIFSVPISQALTRPQDKFDLINMAKTFDEALKGPFDRLDLKLEEDFTEDSSKLRFEIELLLN